MVNVIIHVSKYILAILAASYAMKCFTVFSDRHEYDRGSVYTTQNVLMFLIHFICYLIIYLMTKDMKMLYFYGAQFVLFIVTLIIYGTVYKNASRLIVNNMCYLLMVGFVILTRLDFDMAVRQFIIAVAAACVSLVIPAFMLRVRMVDKWGTFLGVLGFLMIASVFVLGRSMYGATNWISIGGFSLQPSELAKIVFVFFVAAMLARDTSFKRICHYNGGGGSLCTHACCSERPWRCLDFLCDISGHALCGYTSVALYAAGVGRRRWSGSCSL